MPVIAALSPTDCFDAAYEAAKIALEHLTPVILLTDAFIANGSGAWKLPKMEELKAALESVKGQLEHVMAEKRALEQKVSELSQTVPQPSSLRIADKKKTPVMVVLHAMYKAGWIKAGTRDETVIEAARLLFGESVTSLRQLLSIAKSNGTFSSYIEKAENSMENEWDELKNAVKDEK
jgi:hypothetical protein